MEPKLTYDESLMIQKLRSLADSEGTVTMENIATAFWTVSVDLELAILHHKPEKLEEARAKFLKEMAPMFVGFLKRSGLRLRDD